MILRSFYFIPQNGLAATISSLLSSCLIHRLWRRLSPKASKRRESPDASHLFFSHEFFEVRAHRSGTRKYKEEGYQNQGCAFFGVSQELSFSMGLFIFQPLLWTITIKFWVGELYWSFNSAERGEDGKNWGQQKTSIDFSFITKLSHLC